MKDFQVCACGICETDCEYHRPAMVNRPWNECVLEGSADSCGVISEETLGNHVISADDFVFNEPSTFHGLKAWLPNIEEWTPPDKDGNNASYMRVISYDGLPPFEFDFSMTFEEV